MGAVRAPKILVADDESGLLELMRRRIQRLGHASDEAHDGKAAADLIEKNAYDLIVADITMPGHTGLELLALAKERDPQVQVVIITADATMETAIEALNRGAFSYLAKPFPHLSVFDQTILRALEFRRMVMETSKMGAAQRRRGDLLEEEVQDRLLQVRRLDRETRQMLAHIPEGILVEVRGRAMPSNTHAEKWLSHDAASPDRPLSAFLEALSEGSGDRQELIRLDGTTLEVKAVDLGPSGASGHLVILRDLNEPARELARRLGPALASIRRDLDAEGEAWAPGKALRKIERLESLLRLRSRPSAKKEAAVPAPRQGESS
ncbi:MAG: response regulator [Anaerolineales bacterium]